MVAITSCEFQSLNQSGEDTGFNFIILNRSDIEYKGLNLYMGALDKNNSFIAVDSLFYPDFIIPKKGEVDKIEEATRASESFPFEFDNTGLDENNVWVPKVETIKKVSIDNKVYFKAMLGKEITFSGPSASISNGTTILTILEDGSFDW